MKLVILAGGSGKRLWPVSTSKNPKQITKIFRSETLLEATYNRLLKVASKKDIYIATSTYLAPKIKKILKIKDQNLIIEPAGRDTAPAIALAVSKLLKYKNETVGFIPSDHHIENSDLFSKAVILADKVVQKTQKFVNFGISPTSANTGYGYLEIGDLLNKKTPVFEFIRQIEKPNKNLAKKYVKQGFLWNGGYFFWTPQKFLQAFDKYLGIGEDILKMSNAAGEKLKKIYNNLPKVSLDYALIEKLELGEGATIRVDFGWEDLGSWSAIHKIYPNKILQNAIHSNWHGFDTKDCLIYAPKKKLVATFGIKDLVVVDTGDTLLVMPKNRSGEIKNLLDLLEKNGQGKFL